MKSFANGIVMAFALFAICGELQGADVKSSRVPKNSIEEVDGVVTISVFIDKRAETKVKELEGTAMLRTNRLLRRQFKELPRNFSLPVSVERADYDANEEIYTYVTKIQRCDIETFIKDYKEQEKQRIAAEKAAAEKAAAEKAAAEKAAAEKAEAEKKAAAEKAAAEKAAAEKAAAEKAEAEKKAAAEKASAEKAEAEKKAAAEKAAAEKAEAEKKETKEREEEEKLSVTRAAEQKVVEARRTLDAKEQSQSDGKGHLRIIQSASPREDEAGGKNGNASLIEESKSQSLGELKPETAEEAKQRNANETKMADDAVMNLFK